MSVSDKKALFCECKWRNEKVDCSVVNTLLERGELFAYQEKYYCIFSKSGFSNEVRSLAEIVEGSKLKYELMQYEIVA